MGIAIETVWKNVQALFENGKTLERRLGEAHERIDKQDGAIVQLQLENKSFRRDLALLKAKATWPSQSTG